MKYFPYLPSDTEQRQQADALKEKYRDVKKECFTLIGEHRDAMLLVLLSYNEDSDLDSELL
jgi:hypothetical protein